MGNARFVIVLAAALAGIGCATGGSPPASSAAALSAPGSEEVHFMGYRLVVQKDAAGKAISAEARDSGGTVVPSVVVPIGDVKVCPPRPPGDAAGAPPVCEPFSFLPEKTSFKTGTNSICWYYSNGYIIYYKC